MKKLLKYLLPVIVAFAFWNCEERYVSTVAEEVSEVMSLSETSCQTEISESESELCLPRQVSFAGSHRVQSAPRRTTGTHRNNLEFTKSGKVINAGIRYFVQRKSIIIHSSLVEPSFRLLSLGKLII